MAISTVRVQIDGSWYSLSKQSDGSWQAKLTAPNKTPFNMSGGCYPLTVEATNDAGTSGTDSIQLVVKERIIPVITMVSPGQGAYVTNNRQPVVFTLVDEEGGSGIDLNSLQVKLDDVVVSADELVTTALPLAQTGGRPGYSVTLTPGTAMADGEHYVDVFCSDNDGNEAEEKSVVFTVDTVPPVLVVNSPAEGLVTALAAVAVSGKTNDATSSPVAVKIALNGADQGSITVGSDGSFSKTVQLAEGTNSIVVTATDAAGRSTEISRSVKLDSSVPKIVSATAAPNPVDAGATMTITVVVE